MKKKLVGVVIGMMMTLCSFAYETWTDPSTGLTWKYEVIGNEVSVGGGDCDCPALSRATTGAVAIPSIINEMAVTHIGAYAFAFCEGLTSITIPQGVTSIGRDAFTDCYCLKSVEIPSSVIHIGKSAFWLCREMSAVTIPEGVKDIGEWAFELCTNLTQIAFPTSVTNIGCGVVSKCYTLNDLIVSDGNQTYKSESGLLLTKDGQKLLACVGAKTVLTIPYGVTCICKGALAGCHISTLDIPSGVTSVEDFACYGCGELESVTISASVTNMGWCVFDCPLLSSVLFQGAPFEGWDHGFMTVDAEARLSYPACDEVLECQYNVDYEEEWLEATNPEYGRGHGFMYTPVVVDSIRPDGGPYTEIIDDIEWTFMVTNNEAVLIGVPKDVAGDVEIPCVLGGRSVTGIGWLAFDMCSSLISVTIPSSVTSIGGGAFEGCIGLKELTIPSSVTNIERAAVYDCSHLRKVVFEGLPPNHWAWGVPGAWAKIYYNDDYAEEWEVALAAEKIDDAIPYRPGSDPVGGGTVSSCCLTVTNVVVQYVLNSVQPEIAVPVSGDTGFVTTITEVKSSGAVSVPSEWTQNYPQFETMYGADFGKALMKKSGKKDGAGNDMLVWQDFVAGTDPTDENDKFTASITLVDGVPVVSYTPELTAEQKALRTYKTYGKVQLQDSDWTDITNLDGEAKKPYNFFKVTVEMK